MRRGFSTLLILVFGLMPLSALVPGSEDASLPACCRRHGAHHCAMNVAAMRAMMARDSGPGFTAPVTCPYYPGAATAFTTPPPALTVAMAGTPTPALQAQVVPAAPAAPETCPSFAYAGRGPPLSNLS